MKQVVRAILVSLVIVFAGQGVAVNAGCRYHHSENVFSSTCCPGGRHWLCCCYDCSGRYDYYDCDGVMKITPYCCRV